MLSSFNLRHSTYGLSVDCGVSNFWMAMAMRRPDTKGAKMQWIILWIRHGALTFSKFSSIPYSTSQMRETWREILLRSYRPLLMASAQNCIGVMYLLSMMRTILMCI